MSPAHKAEIKAGITFQSWIIHRCWALLK